MSIETEKVDQCVADIKALQLQGYDQSKCLFWLKGRKLTLEEKVAVLIKLRWV